MSLTGGGDEKSGFVALLVPDATQLASSVPSSRKSTGDTQQERPWSPHVDVVGSLCFMGSAQAQACGCSACSFLHQGQCRKTTRGPKNQWLLVTREMVLLVQPNIQGQSLGYRGRESGSASMYL